MRTVRILCGLAVLIATLAYGHLVYHFYSSAPHDNPILWVGLVFAIIVGAFSFLGCALLLKPVPPLS